MYVMNLRLVLQSALSLWKNKSKNDAAQAGLSKLGYKAVAFLKVWYASSSTYERLDRPPTYILMQTAAEEKNHQNMSSVCRHVTCQRIGEKSRGIWLAQKN